MRRLRTISTEEEVVEVVVAEEVVGRTLLHEPKTNPWVKFRRGEDQPGWNGFCEQRLFPSLQNPFANLQVHVISM